MKALAFAISNNEHFMGDFSLSCSVSSSTLVSFFYFMVEIVANISLFVKVKDSVTPT